MATPKTIPSKLNKSGYVKSISGSLYITSILKSTSLRLNGTSISETLNPQEFHSPIQCSEFQADPNSVSYIVLGSAVDVWSPVISDFSEDLVGWYDSSDFVTINTNSTHPSVSVILDKSSSLNDLIQSNPAKMPITENSNINGLNVLEFDGADNANAQQFVSSSFDVNANGDFSVIGVMRIDETSSANDSLWALKGDSSFQFDARVVAEFAGRIETNNNGTLRLNDGPASATRYSGTHIFANIFDFNDVAKFFAHVDGEDVTDGGSAYTIKLGGGTPSFTVAVNRGQNRGIKGAMAEIVVSDDVSSSTIEKTEGYLAHKWGLTANLPSSHSYKNSPPSV